MNNKIINWWKNIDQISFVIVVFFIIIGIVLSFSINKSFSLINRHLIYAIVSLILIIVLSNLKIKTLRRLAFLGLIICLLILITILLLDYDVKGSKRWLKISGFSLQPSEFVKPFFLMISGWFLSRGIQGKKASMYFIFSVFFILAGLIILQPDFGMTVLFSISFFCQLFIAGLSLILVSLAILFLVGLSVTSYFAFDHVKKRIDIFFDPSGGDTYQIGWSIKAFKSGNIFGKGPGQGTLKEKIPDANTDFIFAVAGEELGFLVCFLIVLLILILVIRLLISLFKIDKPDKIIAIIGLSSCYGLQALINIFSSLGVIPTKGMTLPLISYGGSSMISSAILFGFLFSLTRKDRK